MDYEENRNTQSLQNKEIKIDSLKIDIKKAKNSNFDNTYTSEHTFGDKRGDNTEVFQMQNLKNAIKENEIFTERRIDPKANLKISKLNYEESEFDIYQNMAMKVSQSDTKISNQFNAMTVQSDLIQKEKQTKQLNSNNTNTQIINSKNEIRLEQNSRHSEVDSLIKTSEMCFNSVLNKMNDDLNPRVLQKIPNNELNLGKIRKK